ncbi:MAG: inositol monophosphatase family protein [Bacteroidales bacterium]
MNLKFLCTQVTQIVVQTGKFIQQQQKKITLDKIEQKGINDFVTSIDKEAEQRLIGFLTPLIQNAGFIAEENTVADSNAEYKWIIDPIDGTTNYIHGVSPFAISIALQHKGKTILGIIYEISLNEVFYAHEDAKGAYLNDRPIKVSDQSEHNQSLIATGFPYNDFTRLEKYMESLNFFMHQSQGLRRLGSAATDLAYVACGRFEAFYEYSLKPWDVAAGAYLVQKAGGKTSDFTGGDKFVFGGEIVAANSNYYDTFLKEVQRHLL